MPPWYVTGFGPAALRLLKKCLGEPLRWEAEPYWRNRFEHFQWEIDGSYHIFSPESTGRWAETDHCWRYLLGCVSATDATTPVLMRGIAWWEANTIELLRLVGRAHRELQTAGMDLPSAAVARWQARCQEHENKLWLALRKEKLKLQQQKQSRWAGVMPFWKKPRTAAVVGKREMRAGVVPKQEPRRLPQKHKRRRPSTHADKGDVTPAADAHEACRRASRTENRSEASVTVVLSKELFERNILALEKVAEGPIMVVLETLRIPPNIERSNVPPLRRAFWRQMDRLNDHAAWRELDADHKQLANDIATKLWKRVDGYAEKPIAQR